MADPNDYPYSFIPGVAHPRSLHCDNTYGTDQEVRIRVLQEPDPLVVDINYDGIQFNDDWLGDLAPYVLVGTDPEPKSTVAEFEVYLPDGSTESFTRTFTVEPEDTRVGTVSTSAESTVTADGQVLFEAPTQRTLRLFMDSREIKVDSSPRTLALGKETLTRTLSVPPKKS